ncbi:polysaccharide pyruvyl transferase family protein [Povalibacter sp.]|uniref:polysaccharide pyruvyl transferase family protein n=1 Tax=Povalibacter sp. TaxID=1962978 RepID=UPI002F3F235C
MEIRTFYWDAPRDRRPAPLRWLRPNPHLFRHGNAGDDFNVDLLKWAYPGREIRNVDEGGHRLLLVGSISHRVQGGDIVNGIGSKPTEVPSARQAPIRVRGVRGPLTLEAFRRAGHDVSSLRFVGDPGLLIGRLFPDLATIPHETGRVVFIPHYRERYQFRSNRKFQVVDIDASAHDVAVDIRRAEFVHTSSLHGLIWAHALGRPARLVTPAAGEALHKYEDYYLSIDQSFEAAATIDESLRLPKSVSPLDVSAVIKSITLPDLAELLQTGIAT